ncbi:MAG: glycoside hydrolase family 15 protein [Acidimicrobiales bacterium]
MSPPPKTPDSPPHGGAGPSRQRLGAFVADADAGTSPFPPIAEYGFLSDCQVNALIAPSGNVEWLCLPRPDSPSVFGAILDRSAGTFRVGPAAARVPAGRRYVPGTNVLETTWQTANGWLIVRDALIIRRWYYERERSPIHRRVPADYDAECTLLRTVECVTGSVAVSLDCEPMFDYARSPAQWSYVGEGYGEALAEGDAALPLRLTTDLRLGFEGSRASARAVLREGQHAFVALSWSDQAPPRVFEEAAARMDQTIQFWRRWLSYGNFPDHPWRTHLQRSALVLKGLSYAPTGALLAAATTSLPETPQGERNWDYRFSWIRDSTFMLWALYTLGFDWEANDFFYFVADLCEASDLQVMYGVGGETKLDEHLLEHLSGYEGAQPVRIGNAAYLHRQHDVWGAVLDSVYLHTKSRDHLPERVWPILVRQVETALENWRLPDRGIWEVRGEPQHFTSSKVMCWVAVDRGSRLAAMRGDHETAQRWKKAAEEIHADICANGVDERGVFTQHYGTKSLDASLLLMPLVRFLRGDDPRVRATVSAIADELTVDGLVLRYLVDETDDGLSGEEGTFVICSFWLVAALAEIGEGRRARTLCEKLLSYASPLGLYAEEIDALSGRHLGNFPQAFTHLALINAVMHVIRADRQT